MEFHRQSCKFQRVGNLGSVDRTNQKGEEQQHQQDDEEVGSVVVKRNGIEIGGICGWPSSRIVRVSRASGGKDRHSKVLTSKGLRDRRVRLSVTTAIQFYDLQDRLGYDQPSKAVEWLLKAAAGSIAELPSLNTPFLSSPRNVQQLQLSDEKRSRSSSGHTEQEFEFEVQQQQLHNGSNSLSKSACSSTSETSKGSGGISLSRSESRMKARERARERAADKEKEKDVTHHFSHQQNTSFTELLTSGGGGSGSHESSLRFNKEKEQWNSPVEYLSFVSPSSSSRQIQQLGNSIPQFGEQNHVQQQQQQQQHFSLVPENFAAENYNLNFSMSSPGLSGFHRGTLQSNSQPLLPHLQRFPPMDGTISNLPIFMGSNTSASNANATATDTHFYPHGLQLYYGDGCGQHSDQKQKSGKN